MEIKITLTDKPHAKPDETALGFGKFFTDHMFLMDYTEEKGWHDARIVPFANLELHPAATVLHYGAEAFVQFVIDNQHGIDMEKAKSADER